MEESSGVPFGSPNALDVPLSAKLHLVTVEPAAWVAFVVPSCAVVTVKVPVSVAVTSRYSLSTFT